MKDTFICGDCQQAFHSLELFVQHKNSGCIPLRDELPPADVAETERPLVEVAINEDEQVQIEPKQEDHNNEKTFTLEDDSGKTLALGPESILIEAGLGGAPSVGLIDGTQVVQIIQADTGEQIEAFIETAQPTQELHLIPVNDSTQALADGTPVASDFRVMVKTTQPPTGTPSGRRRGRPRKGEEKNPPKPKAPPPEKKDNRPKLPPKGADGKYTCIACKKSFLRERHFLTHRCMSIGDYVDLSRKDALGSDDDESEEETDEDKDKTVEFSQSRLNPSHRGRPRGSRNKPKQDIVKMAMEATIDAPTAAENGEISNQPKSGEGTTTDNKDPDIIAIIQPEADGKDTMMTVDAELAPLATHRDQIPDIPIFANEEDRLDFEKNLDNIDLSAVDNMFNVHVIAQDVNENAPPITSRMNSELSIFSCKTCEKVFKTPSHMRLHCLTHTDLRPFTCHKCDYASNSKGNLYTHMRKHSGQYFRCSRCDFYTVNKSHLVEHMETHSGVKHKCNLCHKHYSSVKSLMNHIRRYHCNTATGKEYLAEFQGHGSKNYLLHQCHVCNRKFKKESDRDRHLYAHNIRSRDLFPCDMCEFAGAHQDQLEKHYPRHRVVYICSECGLRFPSTIRLNQHLSADHECSDMDEKWVEMFQQCINISMFLPEPGTSTIEKKDEDQGEGTEETFQIVPAVDVNLQIACEDGQTEGQTETPAEGQDSEVPPQPCPEDYVIINPGVDDNEESIITEETTVENMTDTMTMMDTEEVTEDMSALQVSLPAAEEPNGMETNEASDAVANIEQGAAGQGEQVVNEEPEPLPSDYDILQQLSYVPMNMEVFHKLRQTYGNEECEFCGRLFYSLVDYEPHIRTHTGSKPFPCTQCAYRSNTKDNLKRHIEKEHEKVKYVCNACEFVASSRTQLWHHQQKHKQPVELNCPKCQVKVKGAKFLRIHLGIKHPELTPDEVKHIVTGSKPQGKLGRRSFKCPYCPKTFLRASSDLQKHIWIHEGIKPFKCPHCPHACRSKNNLAAHLLKHSSVKPFQCTVGGCGKLYKSKTALRWHERVHKDGRIFKCHVCQYEAIQRSHLKRHMETHNVVKRFVCHHCDYSCNTLGFMKIHYTRHHKDANYTYNPAVTKPSSGNARVYRCLSCDYLFGNLSDMKRHLKVRHHLQVEEICMLDDGQGNQTAQIVTSDIDPANSLELQVVKVTGEGGTTADERDATAALQTLQYATVPGGTSQDDQATVSFLQQIIDISQEGALTTPQQITVMDDGQKVAVNQNTIFVSQDCEEVVVADGAEQQNSMFVIQYVNPDGTPAEMPPETASVITSTAGATSLLANATITSSGQLITQNDGATISSDGQILDKDSFQIVEASSGQVIGTSSVGEMVSESELAVTSSELEAGMLLPPEEEVSGQSIMQLQDGQYVQLDESGVLNVQTTDMEGTDLQQQEEDGATQLVQVSQEGVSEEQNIQAETIDV